MATKGKTNTKSKTTKSTKASNNTPTKSTSTPKTKSQDFIEPIDPFFKESTKEIILWLSIAVCILLIISNFGLGGTVGNAIADFLFGLFGLTQYILPFMAALAVFFLISNYCSIVSIAKTIAGALFFAFFETFIELIENGTNLQNAIECYFNSKTSHNGGGFIGGGISFLLNNFFGLFGAYLIDIIFCILFIMIIFEHSAYHRVQSYSRQYTDAAAERRRIKREQRQLEKETALARYNNNRISIREKIQDNISTQEEEMNQAGPRRDRKHTGISTDTLISDPNMFEDESVNEIRFNMGERDLEVTDTSRHKLVSGINSTSHHKFSETESTAPIEEVGNTKKTSSDFAKELNPVINIPSSNPSPVASPIKAENHFTNTYDVEDESDDADAVQETKSRRHKPTITSEKEMDSEANAIQKTVENSSAKPKKAYKFPPLNLLKDSANNDSDSQSYLKEMSLKLQRTLSNFGVEANVAEVTLGPSVTQYKISINEGTKVSKVLNLSDDIKLNLAVTDVRIEAPIPGEPYIGIEVPNKTKTMVAFKDLVKTDTFKNAASKVSFCVGKDIQGHVIVGNIEKMPHLLIAGATGSGKSVCINTIIMSILYHAKPDEVKLIMVDPKMVELSVYNGIPHLLIPVVTDAKKAAGALHWAVKEMTDRYELLALAGVRNITNFNQKVDSDTLPDSIPEEKRKKMPQIVIILDELADLMMVAAADVEDSIVRLAQLARAAGIHLIIATQRPTSNVITGLIKANVPSRIAFSVSSAIDSRVILDMNGAEDLLGNGDMLYAPQNASKPIRIQGAFVSDDEVNKVVEYLKANNDSTGYDNNVEEAINNADSTDKGVTITGEIDDSRDSLFAEAGRLVIESQKGSIGYLQRNFRIGFNRAARIMDQLAEAGVVGPEMGTKPREIRMSVSEFEDFLSKQ